MDYTQLGFNQRMEKVNGLLDKREFVTPLEFDRTYQVQAKDIIVSKMRSPQFIGTTTVGSAQGTFGNGANLIVTVRMNTNTRLDKYNNFTIPYITLYEDSVHGSQVIYPYKGGSITVDDYRIFSGFSYRDSVGTETWFTVNVNNVAAGNVTLIALTQWRFTDHAYLGTFV